MSRRFVYQRSVVTRTPSADEIAVHDLAVNPLSAILLNIQPLNDTGTLANFASYLKVCQAFNRITVQYKGQQLVGMRGEDAAAMAYFRHGIIPFQGQHRNTNNERRSVTLPILMGKNFLDPMSCFPASRRGELTIELDIDIADTGYDGLRYSIDTVEILDAKPSEFEKKVQITHTFPATGQQDFELPVSLKQRGILLWGTTGFGGASPAPSWGTNIRVLMNNTEHLYANIDFETLQMLHCMWGRLPPTYDDHKHIITTDGLAQTELATLAGVYDVGLGWDKYAFMDFDPTRDDMYTLDTSGANSLKLRASVAAEAVRAIPIEVVQTKDLV